MQCIVSCGEFSGGAFVRSSRHRLTVLTRVIPSNSALGRCRGGALQAGLLDSALNMLLVVRFMLAYARITMMPWYLFENERIIWSL